MLECQGQLETGIVLTPLSYRVHTLVSRSCVCHYTSKCPLPQSGKELPTHVHKGNKVQCRFSLLWKQQARRKCEVASQHVPGMTKMFKAAVPGWETVALQ